LEDVVKTLLNHLISLSGQQIFTRHLFALLVGRDVTTGDTELGTIFVVTG